MCCVSYGSQVALVCVVVVVDLFGQTDGFFMGTKHTTPPTQLPMFNHKGKTYAKVGDQYVEYNDDEMYYDRHDKMKNQDQLNKEAQEAIREHPMESNSDTRKEEKYRAELAWKQAKREEVDDVTGMPMYEGETYNQYGKMEYGKEPELYGGQPLGGTNFDEPHYGPPLNPYYGGPNHPQGEEPMHKEYEVPDILGGRADPRMFANPFGGQMGFGGPAQNVRQVDADYANYIRNPPRGIYTICPLSEEKTTTDKPDIPHHTEQKEEAPYGMMPNISADSFERYHGPDGLLNIRPYGRDRRVIELNEKRASYAFYMHSKQNSPDFDDWTPPSTSPHYISRTTMTRTTTTEFVPRADITIPNYIMNF